MRSFKKPVTLSLVLLLAIGSSANGFAEDTAAPSETEESTDTNETTDQKLDQMKNLSLLIDKGTEAFKAQNFSSAAAYFEKAFAVSPDQRLLKNAMVAWYKNKNCKEAARVASLLVAFIGKKDLSGKIDSEVTTVVNCALDDVNELIEQEKYDDAKVLLLTASSCAPTSEQKARIDVTLSKVTRLERKKEEETVVEEEPSRPKTTLESVTPWVALGCGVAGSAMLGAGGYLLGRSEPKVGVGAALAAVGSLSLMGSVAALVLWLKPTADADRATAVYYNVGYAKEGGVSSVSIEPIVTPEVAAASLTMKF